VPVIAEPPPCSSIDDGAFHPPIGSIIENSAKDVLDFSPNEEFIRVTDDQ